MVVSRGVEGGYMGVIVKGMTQIVKNLPAMQETRVWSLGQEDPLEEEMTACFSTLALEIPWTEEPGGLQSMRFKSCRFNPWVRKIPWRRKWQSTLVFVPGKSHGPRSLVGYRPWGRKELDTTSLSLFKHIVKWHHWLLLCYDVCTIIFPGSSIIFMLWDGNPLQHSCLENPMDRGAW